MKKAVSKLLVILGAVVAALVVVIIVLSVVCADPASPFEGYDRAEIYNFGSNERIEVYAPSTAPDDSFAQNSASSFSSALGDLKYSQMQSLLEGKAGGSWSFKSGSAENGREERDAEDIAGLASTESVYMIRFFYSAPRKLEINGETLEYDCAVLFLYDSHNEIREMEAVFYLDSRIGNEAEDEENSSEYYTVPTALVKCVSTKLCNAVADIIAARTAR